MFKGRVEKVSHEGGLLVSYSGACPALGSVMVDSNEEYVGKVDGVIGNLNESLVHIAHLDRKSKPDNMVGIEITIRTKRQRSDSRTNNRQNKFERKPSGQRDKQRSQRNYDRDNRSRGKQKGGTHSNNDWTCNECGNSNFSFRTECNRCGIAKGRGKPRQQKKWSGDERRFGDRRQEKPEKRAGDWDCPQCGKSNFAKRTDCFSCGRSKRVGGPRTKGHHRKLREPKALHSVRYGRGDRRKKR